MLLNFATITLILGLLAAVALVFFRNSNLNKLRSKRIAILIENARSLAAGRKPTETLQGNDELAELANIHHKMYSIMSRMRQRERAFLDHAAEGICSLDENLRFVTVNFALEAILESSGEMLRGSRLSQYLDDDALESAREALFDAKESLDTKRFQIKLRRNNGPIFLAWSVVWDPEQREYYCQIQDITEKVRLEELKNDFVSMVSHDLRTPLTSIQLSHDFLSEEPLSKEALETLRGAQRSVKRLMSLVNNVLDLDKLEAGSMSLYPHSCKICSVVNSCVESMAALAQQKDLKITLKVNPELEGFFDEEKISQVLINLLSNAVKYSPNDSEIVVQARVDGKQLVVSVSDSGPGIPEEFIQSIFEKFRQVNKDDKARGSGLGLAICRSIISHHGGEIAVESRPGGGSTFWFSLPTREEDLPKKN